MKDQKIKCVLMNEKALPAAGLKLLILLLTDQKIGKQSNDKVEIKNGGLCNV